VSSRRPPLVAFVAIVAALGLATLTQSAGSRPTPRAHAAAASSDWPVFGHDPQRTGFSTAATGITAADVGHLRRIAVALPGTVDSSPIFLHAVRIAGASHDVFVMTTTYGRTVAMDAHSGALLWTFTPTGIAGWSGSAQITNASPAADPDRRWVYAASPDGRVHKIALATGREAGGRWPVTVTRDPTHEKMTSSLNVSGPRVIVTTGGYIGDAPPYDGKAVTIERASGKIDGVFNSLCANRHAIYQPSTCNASDSAIWARSGAVVEPDGDLLVATGNGPYNGTTNFGDSVVELSPDAKRVIAHFTPVNQAMLNSQDLDFGSSAPALLPGGYSVMGGKDAVLRLLNRRLRQVQTLKLPQGLFNAEAVHGSTVYVTTFASTAAYGLTRGHLKLLWTNGNGATSPLIAGGLLYVYNPGNGNVNVYTLGGHKIAVLDAKSGHWNSPMVGAGAVAVPEGNANDHSSTGTLSLFTTR
jgi:hypothetical protein